MKPALYLFFGPNWLYGAFGGKIGPDENFTQFCLKCPIEFVFANNTFLVGIFWRNWPHTSFLGLIGYMVRSGTNLFRTKTLLNFASEALSNSLFQKKVFGLNFCTKSHLTYFLGQTDKMARLGAKVARSEVSSIQKNTFSVGIFW